MDTTMMYSSLHEDQSPLNKNNMYVIILTPFTVVVVVFLNSLCYLIFNFFSRMNAPLDANDSNSECYVLKTTQAEHIVPTNVSKDITLEDVMKEIVALRQMVYDMREVSGIVLV